MDKSKQDKTKETKLLKKESRKSKEIKVYICKLSVKGKKLKFLDDRLMQCKTLVNSIILDPFNYNRKSDYISTKRTSIFYEWGLDKDNNLNAYKNHVPDYVMSYVNLPYRVKSALRTKMLSMVKSLSSKKKNGEKVGKIKYIKNWNIIPLEVYPSSFRIENNRMKIENCPYEFRLISFDKQLPLDAELTNGEIVKKDNGYFLHFTFYTEKKNFNPSGCVGIDFGIKNAINTWDGKEFKTYQLKFNDSKRIKHIQKYLSKKKLDSNRRKKTVLKLRKLYTSLKNKKRNAINKIVYELTTKYETICVQNDSFKGWQMGFFGKQISDGSLYLLKQTLKRKSKVFIEIPKNVATTKTCAICGLKKEEIGLEERIFSCICGNVIDRDCNSAMNMYWYGYHTSVKTADYIH